MKHSLSSTGLSLSQASSISNMCFQRAQELERKLKGFNNASKTIKVSGETFTETEGNPLPDNVLELLLEKCKLHACQSFLMTNIKAKEYLLNQLKTKRYENEIKEPEVPNYNHIQLVNLVDENWGWNQLSIAELNEFFEQEAYAAHLGQFIHKGEILDKLREELPSIKKLQWLQVKEGEKTPIKVTVHHTSEELLNLHESIALRHRQYEMRVNYFKAKVKNLVTEENARIASENGKAEAKANKINQILRNEYDLAYKAFSEEVLEARQKFENQRQKDTQVTAALRIQVDKRFQEIVTKYMPEE